MTTKKKSNVETTTLERVSEGERKSWIDVALIQAGVMICVPSLMLGGLLAASMPLSSVIISGTAGYLIATVVLAVMGMQGSDLGVPTCVVSQSSFGKQGGKIIISTLFTFSMVGWFAIQTDVCGAAFSNLMKTSFGIDLPVKFSMIIWGVIMLITAVYGINALKNLNSIAVPALVLVTIIGCGLAMKQYGTQDMFVSTDDDSMTIVQGIALTISFLAVGMVTSPDFTRYQRNRAGAIKSSVIGIMPAGLIMLLMGSFMSKITGQYDISIILCDIGIPLLGMLVLILATWTTNTVNAYSAGLDLVMLFNLKDDKRAMVTMIAGVIGTVLAVAGVANSFEGLLNWLGYTFAPLAGVMMADYWIVRKGAVEKWGYREGFDWIGIVSWLVGVPATIFMTFGLPIIQGLLLSGLIYVVLRRIFGENQQELGADGERKGRHEG